MNWKLKDVLMMGIISALFGVIYLGCTYIGGILSGVLTPMGLAALGYEPFYGIYFMAGAFGVYIMRKPGAGIISELLAAVIECLLGNYFGPIIILSGLIQGIGIELLIAIFRYKKFSYPVMILTSIICSVLTLGYNLVISGYSKIAAPVLLLMLVVRIISAIVFSGIVTKYVCDRLAKAGVLRGYAIGKDFGLSEE
jgi:energy-coupling factor transport system substrate-specific component